MEGTTIGLDGAQPFEGQMQDGGPHLPAQTFALGSSDRATIRSTRSARAANRSAVEVLDADRGTLHQHHPGERPILFGSTGPASTNHHWSERRCRTGEGSSVQGSENGMVAGSWMPPSATLINRYRSSSRASRISSRGVRMRRSKSGQ